VFVDVISEKPVGVLGRYPKEAFSQREASTSDGRRIKPDAFSWVIRVFPTIRFFPKDLSYHEH